MEPPVDAELVERYVLGRATDEERRRLDELLTESPAWRDAVRRELAIVEGVRRAGREQLKDRLRSRFSEPARSSIPWARIVAAAAVLAVIAGIAVVNSWFPGADRKPPAITESVPAESPAADEATPSEARTETRETPPPATEERDAFSDRWEDRHAPALPAAKKLETAPGGDAGRTPEAAAQDAVYPGGTARKKTASAGSRETPGEVTTVAWSTGSELPARTVGESSEVFRSEQKAAPPNVFPEDSRQQEARVKVYQAPLSRVQLQKDRMSNRFPVSFAQVGDTIELTLYLDPPLETNTLQQAQVHPVPPDSLFITAGTRNFGVRIPGSLVQQQLQQRVRVK